MSSKREEYTHNIWAFSDDHIIENDGSVVMAIELFKGDLSCLSNEEINRVGESMAHALESFEDGTEIYVTNHLLSTSAYKDTILNYAQYDQSRSKLFSRNKIESLNNRVLLKPRIVFIIRKEISEPALKKYFIVLDKIKRDIQTAMHYFNGSIFKTKILNDSELFNLYYQYLNDTDSYTNYHSKQSELLDKDIEVGKSFIRVGDKLRRTISLYKLPFLTEPGQLMNFCNGTFLNPPFEFKSSVKINVVNQKKVLSKLKNKSLRKSILSELAVRKNYEAEASLEEIDDLLSDNAQNGTKLLNYSFNIHVTDTTKKGLDYKTDQILNILRNLEEGSQGIVEEYDQLNLFLNHLPGLTKETIRNHLVTSKNAADMLPVYKNWEGTDHPKQIFFNRNHGLLPLDLFDDSLQGYNAIIFGSTGSGKSFTANYLLQSFLSQGKSVTIIDIGGSYKKLVSLFDGEYFEINNNISLNPFYEPTDIKIEKDIKIGVLSTIIESMISEDKGCDASEKAIIDEALTQLYNKTKNTPILSEYEEELHKLKDNTKFSNDKINSIVERLHIWTNGRYAKMINQRDTIHSNKNVVAFDLKGLDKRLQSVVLNILSGLIWNRITNTSGEKIVLFDEVWALFKSESSSIMIEELYRTARKYHAGIYAISQSLEDFTNSKISAAIMNNSILRFCLKLKDKPEIIKKHLGLNEYEVSQVRQLRSVKGYYSEMFLCFSDQHCVSRIIPSPLEYWVCTTSRKDLDEENKYQSQYPDMPYLERLQKISKEYPNGC